MLSCNEIYCSNIIKPIINIILKNNEIFKNLPLFCLKYLWSIKIIISINIISNDLMHVFFRIL